VGKRFVAAGTQARSLARANPRSVDRLDAYLERLASDSPVPGGGSAATLVAAIGAALTAMVGRIAGRRPKPPDAAATLAEIVTRSEELRAELKTAQEHDEKAFQRVVSAQALPKATPAEAQARREALEFALERAAEAPLRASALCLRVLELAAQLLELETNALVSDIGCAAEFAYAAVAACAYNVRVNHKYMKETATIARQEARLRTHEAAAHQLLHQIRTQISQDLTN
jgi:formiminotetrahydrofolate cyclodeaminase